jgi:hypothetical protein
MSLRTLRVYGFLEDDQGRVLVSAERFKGMPLVKYRLGSLRLFHLGRAGGSRERRRTTGLGTQVGTHEGSLYP